MCSLSFVRGLMARGMIVPDRRFWRGIPWGERSPCGWRQSCGSRVSSRFLLRRWPWRMVSHRNFSCIEILRQSPRTVCCWWERLSRTGLRRMPPISPRRVKTAASSFVLVPRNSHVSVLFSRPVARMAQEWARKVLNLPATAGRTSLPFRGNLLGGVLGLLGILAGGAVHQGDGGRETDRRTSFPKPFIPCAGGRGDRLVSLGVVLLLHYWMPLRVLHLFEGDYLASFFLLAGLLLIALHAGKHKEISDSPEIPPLWLGAAAAALILHLLVTGWLQLTIMGAWMTRERWERFPLFLLAALCFSMGWSWR